MFLFLLAVCAGVSGRRHLSQVSLVRDYTSEWGDPRMPFPAHTDYEQLICGGGGVATSSFLSLRGKASSLPPLTSLSGGCMQDGDCAGDSTATFCVQGVCSECRSDLDCGDVNFSRCSENACSACTNDGDCNSAELICRKVNTPGQTLPRKQCLSCANLGIPDKVTFGSTHSCSDWRCPSETPVVTGGGDCGICPQCADGQFLVPSSDFSLGFPEFFYPSCAGARDPKCIDCAVQETSCALFVAPSDYDLTTIGQLLPQFPCRDFQCKADFFLHENTCTKCDYRSCPMGWFLEGCGGASPGKCVGCPQLTANANSNTMLFIDAKDMQFQVKFPMDVCRPFCPTGFFHFRPSPAVPWACSQCDTSQCMPHQQLTGCGPADNPGYCSECPGSPAPPNWYWSRVAQCTLVQCSFDSCVPGSVLSGCGHISPGNCIPCPFNLPPNSKRWISAFDVETLTQNTCQVECNEGFIIDTQTDPQQPACVIPSTTTTSTTTTPIATENQSTTGATVTTQPTS